MVHLTRANPLRLCHARPLPEGLFNRVLSFHQINPQHSRHSFHVPLRGRDRDCSCWRGRERRQHIHRPDHPDPEEHLHDDPDHNLNEAEFYVKEKHSPDHRQAGTSQQINGDYPRNQSGKHQIHVPSSARYTRWRRRNLRRQFKPKTLCLDRKNQSWQAQPWAERRIILFFNSKLRLACSFKVMTI